MERSGSSSLLGERWWWGVSSHYHILGSFYCSLNAQNLYRVKRVIASANLNQCPLFDRETPIWVFFLLFFPPSKYQQEFLPQESPGLMSSQYQRRLSARHLVFFTIMSSSLISFFRSWFTTGVDLPPLLPRTYSLSAQTNRNRIYRTC